MERKWLSLVCFSAILLGSCSAQVCKNVTADVIFILDDSQNMLKLNSVKVKEFVKDTISQFQIGDDYIRVGSFSFSDWVENNFHLNHHSNISGLLSSIDAITSRQRISFLDQALDFLQKQSFAVANGDRLNAPNIVVIITDGNPERSNHTLKAVKAIKDAGVIMYVVAIKQDAQVSDFAFFGSEPSSEFVYIVDNFDSLDQIKNHITEKICSVKPCSMNTCNKDKFGCKKRIDGIYYLNNSLGCFKDKKDARALPLWKDKVDNVKMCVDRCREANQPYAGLQFGYGCRCGKDYDKYGKADNCNKACKSGEACGGSSANTVYKILSPMTENLGCFQDDPRERALPIWIGIFDSVKMCVDECKEINQPYAGLQFGYGCRCGVNYDKYGKADTCNKFCQHGGACGGYSTNTVYKICDLAD